MLTKPFIRRKNPGEIVLEVGSPKKNEPQNIEQEILNNEGMNSINHIKIEQSDSLLQHSAVGYPAVLRFI